MIVGAAMAIGQRVVPLIRLWRPFPRNRPARPSRNSCVRTGQGAAAARGLDAIVQRRQARRASPSHQGPPCDPADDARPGRPAASARAGRGRPFQDIRTALKHYGDREALILFMRGWLAQHDDMTA